MATRGRANYKELAKWAKSARLGDEGVTVVLINQGLEETDPICEWDHELIASEMPAEDREAWAQEVIDFAQADCDARGNPMSRYQVQRIAEDERGKRRLSFPLFVKVSKEVADDEEEAEKKGGRFDGSVASMFGQQQRHIEKLIGQVITMSQAATEHQRGTLAVLDQSYRFINKLMTKTENQHEKIVERDEEALREAAKAATSSKGAASSDDPFDGMMGMVKGRVAEKLGDAVADKVQEFVMQKLLGDGLDLSALMGGGDETPKE